MPTWYAIEHVRANKTSDLVKAYRTFITSAAKLIRDSVNSRRGTNKSAALHVGAEDDQIERDVDEIIKFEVELAKV